MFTATISSPSQQMNFQHGWGYQWNCQGNCLLLPWLFKPACSHNTHNLGVFPLIPCTRLQAHHPQLKQRTGQRDTAWMWIETYNLTIPGTVSSQLSHNTLITRNVGSIISKLWSNNTTMLRDPTLPPFQEITKSNITNGYLCTYTHAKRVKLLTFRTNSTCPFAGSTLCRLVSRQQRTQSIRMATNWTLS